MRARRFLVFALPILAGCPLTVQEERYPVAQSSMPMFEAEKPIAFEQFLVLMDGAERQAFFELRTRESKERYLQERGLTVKKMLADNLRRGMTTDQVESMLGRPQKESSEQHSTSPTNRFDRVVDEWWVYQRPDTGNLVFIPFRKGWVVEWLLEADSRPLVMSRPADPSSRTVKESLLVHVGEKLPSLLRDPGETREQYVARMRANAPVLFSSGPPARPEPIPLRDDISDVAKTRVSIQEVYSWWGNTSKLYEVPDLENPEHYYSTFTRWTYRIFNGYGYTYYSMDFRDNRLVEWEVHS